MFNVHIQASSSVKAVVIPTYEKPLASYKNKQLHGGILKKLYQHIEIKLGKKISYIYTSRKRAVHLINDGTANLWCIINPNWIKVNKPLHWSQGLFPLKNYIVSLQKTPSISSFEDLKGKRLVGVLGYYYDQITPKIKSEPKYLELIRVRSQEKTLEMIKLERAKYAIVSDLVFEYYRKRETTHYNSPYLLNQDQVHCFITKDIAQAYPKLKTTINELHLPINLKNYYD